MSSFSFILNQIVRVCGGKSARSLILDAVTQTSVTAEAEDFIALHTPNTAHCPARSYWAQWLWPMEHQLCQAFDIRGVFCSQVFLFPFLKLESIFVSLLWGHFAVFIIPQQAPRIAHPAKVLLVSLLLHSSMVPKAFLWIRHSTELLERSVTAVSGKNLWFMKINKPVQSYPLSLIQFNDSHLLKCCPELKPKSEGWGVR